MHINIIMITNMLLVGKNHSVNYKQTLWIQQYQTEAGSVFVPLVVVLLNWEEGTIHVEHLSRRWHEINIADGFSL